MVQTKKLNLYCFSGIFQAFFHCRHHYVTEIYSPFLGTVHHLCMKAVRFTVGSSKQSSNQHCWFAGAGGITKLVFMPVHIFWKNAWISLGPSCRNYHILRYSDSQHPSLYWFISNLIQLFAWEKQTNKPKNKAKKTNKPKKILPCSKCLKISFQ